MIDFGDNPRRLLKRGNTGEKTGQTHMSKIERNASSQWKSRREVFIVVSIVLALAIAFNAKDIFWHFAIKRQTDQNKRRANAVQVASAIRNFADDHNGNLPERLSTLVPEYIPENGIRIFFWPSRSDLYLINLETVKNKIDTNGAFSYRGKAGMQQDMLLVEARSFWPDGGEGQIVTIRSNFYPLKRTRSDVEARLKNLPISSGAGAR